MLFSFIVLVYRFDGGDVSFNPNIDVKTYNTICEEPKGGQIFDVREPEELDTDGRFPGAVNIPRKFSFVFFAGTLYDSLSLTTFWF